MKPLLLETLTTGARLRDIDNSKKIMGAVSRRDRLPTGRKKATNEGRQKIAVEDGWREDGPPARWRGRSMR